MPYQFVPDFKQGMDRTRPLSALPEGSLYELRNAHLTRGGDIEKRKAFTLYKTLPAETFGFHATLTELYVFGSGVNPGVPAGITYQRLQSPVGSAMTELLDATNFDGKVFASAKYADGRTYHFFDGVLVTDFESGVVVSEMVNMDGVAAALKVLLDENDDIAVTRVGNVLTIEKVEAGTFTLEVNALDDEGKELSDAIVAEQEELGSVEVLSAGQFTIVSGVVAPGTNKITSITVNGVEVLGTAVDFTQMPGDTAREVAEQINDYASTPEYRAVSDGGTVIIQAAEGTGSTPNGYVVTVTTAGRFVINTGGFGIIAGSNNPGTNTLSEVKIDGVDLLSGDIDWVTSHTVTAAAVATDINTAAVTAFKAYSEGHEVRFYQNTNSEEDPPDIILDIDTDGDVEISGPIPISSTVKNFSGGAAGVKEKWTVTLAGPFQLADRYTILIDGIRYGAEGNPPEKGTRLLTFMSKIYALSGSLLEFSGVNTATGWNSEDDPGAGFINISTSDGGSQDLIGLETFQGNIAVFSRRAVQIILVDTNPLNNRLTQVVKRTGLLAPKAVLSVNEVDTFYLADSGIRSLRPRDASSQAIAVEDVGTAIDQLLLERIKALGNTTVQKANIAIEPKDGRLMLFLGLEAYVFSYYRIKNILAWSVYDLPGVADEVVEFNGRLYMRSGNSIYLYGGSDDATYDASVVTAQFAFFTAGKPATAKQFEGFDMDCEGEWTLEMLTDPRDLTQHVSMGVFEEFSYDTANSAGIGHFTHIAPMLTCESDGYARISNFAIHYTMAESEAN